MKAALATNPVLVATPTTKSRTEADREWDLLEGLCRRGQISDASAQAAYMAFMGVQVAGNVATSKHPETSMVGPFETWWNMKELAKKVILDLGCMRNVVGVQWANDVVEEWQQHGRWFKMLPEEEDLGLGMATPSRVSSDFN